MFLDPNTIEQLQDRLVRDVQAFLPETILCIGIVLLLILRLFTGLDRAHLGWAALATTLVALVVTWAQWSGIYGPAPSQVDRAFSGLLAYDHFTIYLRLFLFSFAALIIWLSLLTGIPDHEDSADFYSLLLGATVGMALMASANHLLMVYIAVEMASLPSYALAGFLKGRRQSSEASLKYVVYGGGASGVMLYGISLIAVKFGTAYLPDLAAALPQAAAAPRIDLVLVLGFLLLLIGLGFKLAAVPFQFWCPDVFEGAAAEVAAFLSVASKGAALALLGRLVLALVPWHAVALPSQPDASVATGPLASYLVLGLAFFAALTATFGNLAAYPQTNLKRLLAYSTIAHAGYMMMGLAPLTTKGAAAVLFYLIPYLFMNLGAFAVVAFLRNQAGSEDLSSYRGLVSRSPVLVVTLALFLLSLLGIPPLAGFAAKFGIFAALFEAGQLYHSPAVNQPVLGNAMYALLVIAGLNTVFSLVYYANVLKVMILDRPVEEIEGLPPEPLPVPPGSAFYATVMAAMTFAVFFLWHPLGNLGDRGVKPLRPEGGGAAVAAAARPMEVQP
ncbi:MAG TPA: NADH-quinone oxidoreductase subunit N [Gemmataceae bacterium]|nr:NADH-quinone oxidoreductase subunit N [Gemmataceae bacterium]